MQSLRRSIALNASKVAAFRPVKLQVRAMSSTFSSKERAEEALYFRDEDAKKVAELKANLEHILCRDDSDEQKVKLVNLLENKDAKPQAPQGLLAKLGLDDPLFAVPVGIAAAIPIFSKEFMIVNSETFVVAAFMFFCAGIYRKGGPMFTEAMDKYRADIRETIRVSEEQTLHVLHEDIHAAEELTHLEKDTKEVHELVDELSVLQAETLNAQIEHHYRDAIAKKLSTLVTLENTAVANVKSRVVTTVSEDVLTAFKSDKKAKDAALNQALAILAGGANAKMGKDVVGDYFVDALKNYRTTYSKQPAGSDPVLVQLEKDIAAVLAAPAVEEKGGNTYVTHPVSRTFVA